MIGNKRLGTVNIGRQPFRATDCSISCRHVLRATRQHVSLLGQYEHLQRGLPREAVIRNKFNVLLPSSTSAPIPSLAQPSNLGKQHSSNSLLGKTHRSIQVLLRNCSSTIGADRRRGASNEDKTKSAWARTLRYADGHG